MELHSTFTNTGASSEWVAPDVELTPLVIPVNEVSVLPV
jgi:hypothetical protein